ncbi:hypothetical protein B425_0748 [Bacillus amyloliquefaciens]|nr:hypothetical protein B425_0748 [Bacillus amyloliquefaciens]
MAADSPFVSKMTEITGSSMPWEKPEMETSRTKIKKYSRDIAYFLLLQYLF